MIKALSHQFHKIAQPGQGRRGGAQPSAFLLHQGAERPIKPCPGHAETGPEFGQNRRRHFRRRRGRGRAPGRDKVDQGGVGLVPDRRDQGNEACRRRPRQGLVIEGPKILDRSPAARHDQHIGTGNGAARRKAVEAFDRGADLSRRRIPLHHHRPDHHPHGPAVGDTVQNIADHGPCGTGHHPDHRRRGGQGRFARRLEQTFSRKLGLQTLQLGQKRADARRLHGLDDDLIAGSGGIGGDASGDDHFQSLLRLDLQATDRALPHHPVDRRLVVLQRQIDVARGVARDLGNLAAQAHVPESLFERALQRKGQFRNRERRRIGGWGGFGRVESHARSLTRALCLAHWDECGDRGRCEVQRLKRP